LLNAAFARIDEHDLPRLRGWLASLSERNSELRESYRRQGTRHELFFLVRTRESPLLVLISELADREEGAATFLRSNFPIDIEFKNLVLDISRFEPQVELLFDSAHHVEVAAGPKGPAETS
jgi:hypothetical protein